MSNTVSNRFSAWGNRVNRAFQGIVAEIITLGGDGTAFDAVLWKCGVPDGLETARPTAEFSFDPQFFVNTACGPAHGIQEGFTCILSRVDPEVVVCNIYREEFSQILGTRFTTIVDNQLQAFEVESALETDPREEDLELEIQVILEWTSYEMRLVEACDLRTKPGREAVRKSTSLRPSFRPSLRLVSFDGTRKMIKLFFFGRARMTVSELSSALD